MAVQDDLRRLSQMDSVYLGWSIQGDSIVTGWHKGRLQQANDGNWIFRSISSDGAVIGFQLGMMGGTWTSDESPSSGISVQIPITINALTAVGPVAFNISIVRLQQQVPSELTN
jgi:hypothetical protein